MQKSAALSALPAPDAWPYCPSCKGHMSGCPDHEIGQCVWQCMSPKCLYRRRRSGLVNGLFSLKRATERIEAETKTHCKSGEFCSAHGPTDEMHMLNIIGECRQFVESLAQQPCSQRNPAITAEPIWDAHMRDAYGCGMCQNCRAKDTLARLST